MVSTSVSITEEVMMSVRVKSPSEDTATNYLADKPLEKCILTSFHNAKRMYQLFPFLPLIMFKHPRKVNGACPRYSFQQNYL